MRIPCLYPCIFFLILGTIVANAQDDNFNFPTDNSNSFTQPSPSISDIPTRIVSFSNSPRSEPTFSEPITSFLPIPTPRTIQPTPTNTRRFWDPEINDRCGNDEANARFVKECGNRCAYREVIKLSCFDKECICGDYVETDRFSAAERIMYGSLISFIVVIAGIAAQI